MKEQKLVSIVLPTFNRGDKFLKRAIDSVISQTYKNWELIIIDNNSKDNTEELVNSYGEKKIKFFKINNFGIISRSRNYDSKKQGFLCSFFRFLMTFGKKTNLCFALISNKKKGKVYLSC